MKWKKGSTPSPHAKRKSSSITYYRKKSPILRRVKQIQKYIYEWMNERKDKYICTYTEKKTEKQNKYISIYKNSEKIEFFMVWRLPKRERLVYVFLIIYV